MTTAESAEGFAAFETWLGTPLPADPIAALRVLRHQAEQEIERLLDFLDATDGDPDLEGELAGFEAPQDGREGEDTDAEPSLGWLIGGPSARDRSQEHGVDVELDESDAEPSLASPEGARCPEGPPQWGEYVTMPYSQAGWARGSGTDLEGDAHEDDEESDPGVADEDALHGEKGEPDLGATEAFNQDSAWRPQQDGWAVEDGEPECASTSCEDAHANARPTRLGNLDGEDGGDMEPNGDEGDHGNAEDQFHTWNRCGHV
jgi:hypothetical protein